jgi:hypothetical protein
MAAGAPGLPMAAGALKKMKNGTKRVVLLIK